MQGQTFMGSAALAAHLVDVLVDDLHEVAQTFGRVYAPGVEITAGAPTVRRRALTPPPASAPEPKPEPAAQAPQPITVNLTLPAVNVTSPSVSVAPPSVTVNVDSRLEKDSIRVEQSQQSGGGARKIERDASGRPTGIVDAPAPAP
jgi:hypothetical protein